MRFLLITKEYPPIPDASGTIVYHLCSELKKKGHHVDVIARSHKAHVNRGTSGDVFWVQISFWEKLSKKVGSGNCRRSDLMLYRLLTYVRKFLLMFRIHKFPDSECNVTRRTVRTYKKYLKHQKYDCVIGFFRPYSCLSAAMQVAKENRTATSIACYFDLVDAKTRPSLMPKVLYEKLIQKGDRKVMERCNYIMLPVSAHKKENLELNQFPNAIYYEFPTFMVREQRDGYIDPSEDRELRLVFAGTMDRAYRNPESMLQVIHRTAEAMPDRKVRLDVFGGGDCAQLFQSGQWSRNLSIVYHGRVPKEEVVAYEAQAHFLINVMNAYEAIVPSKIFELFASGKPILNFVTHSDDGSLEYFKKYPLCCTIDWPHASEKERTQLVASVHAFMLQNQGRRVDIQTITSLFQKCTPEYVAEQIIYACQKGENG